MNPGDLVICDGLPHYVHQSIERYESFGELATGDIMLFLGRKGDVSKFQRVLTRFGVGWVFIKDLRAWTDFLEEP